MPKSALTGTQKKGVKKLAKLEPKFSKEALKQFERSGRYTQRGQKLLKDIAEGKESKGYKQKTKYEPEEFKPKTKFEVEKFKPQTKYEKSTLNQLVKDFERAGKGAEQIFAPIREQALHQFQTSVLPSVKQAAGASEVKSSSALRQALGASGENLQRSLASDFASLQATLAQNLLGQRESSRQFGAQFGAGQEQYAAQLNAAQRQYAAQHGMSQEQFAAAQKAAQEQFGSQFNQRGEEFANQSALQDLNARLQASGALKGVTLQPQFTGAFQSPYLQSQQKGPSGTQQLIGSGIQAAGTALGAYLGGPSGAAVGKTATSWGTNQLGLT